MIFWITKCDILFCDETLIYYMLFICWENGVLQKWRYTINLRIILQMFDLTEKLLSWKGFQIFVQNLWK